MTVATSLKPLTIRPPKNSHVIGTRQLHTPLVDHRSDRRVSAISEVAARLLLKHSSIFP